MLTQIQLKEVLNYDESTGIFTWKVLSSHTRIGDAAGTMMTTGYVEIKLDGVRYLAHRLAWFYVHGEFPKGKLDHKDERRANNRILNLRPATHAQNIMNSKARSKCGVKNVYWRSDTKSYAVRFKIDGKHLCFGQFSSLEEATAQATKTRLELHGEFANNK